MQVLCKPSNGVSDVLCPICGQGFLLYWERFSRAEQDDNRPEIQQALCLHHAQPAAHGAHPEAPFNIPDWSGQPKFSAAAILSGAVL